jgi:Asp-tRNA(Asn)/Glu-tRNA(Gln) amidotransferase A subunit family amidase
MPTNNDLVPKDKGTTADPKFQSPWTAADFPPISIPSGTDRDRMPLAVQMVRNYLDDYKLLRIAYWIKNVINIKMEVPTIINE